MGEGYHVVVCSECGAGFADGIPAQEEMDRYYAEQSKYSYAHSGGVESPWDFKRFEATVDQLAPYLKSKEVRILDVGCATGGLLSVFKKRGFSNLFGIDPSAVCAATAERLHGIKVQTGSASQLGEWEGSFDLILMVGVLEHLREVSQAIRATSRLLSSGGLLYCAVPDVEGIADCVNAPYQQFSVEHVNFFSIDSLMRLVSACGMAAVNHWRWTVEWREGITEPIASGLFKAGKASLGTFDGGTGSALERYLTFSKENDKRIFSALESLRSSQEPILVWGAGTLTRRLLATTRFAEANIVAFVDSNPHSNHAKLANRSILTPEQIIGRKERILISSISFEKEIIDTIRARNIPNQVFTFLGRDFD